ALSLPAGSVPSTPGGGASRIVPSAGGGGPAARGRGGGGGGPFDAAARRCWWGGGGRGRGGGGRWPRRVAGARPAGAARSGGAGEGGGGAGGRAGHRVGIALRLRRAELLSRHRAKAVFEVFLLALDLRVEIGDAMGQLLVLPGEISHRVFEIAHLVGKALDL